MYCDKREVNLLTAATSAWGCRHVVVCPGSRNGVLVHNFAESPRFVCHAVTDERSAAFVALGIALHERHPVVVCVTSGSALLNTLPAVAEAYYRGLPLVVVSADRPARWIGQNDGQTLPQQGALMPYTPTFQIEERATATNLEETEWLVRRTLAEAFLHALQGHPAHINIALEEPLFSFTTPDLPQVSVAWDAMEDAARDAGSGSLPPAIVAHIRAARFPILLIGQLDTPCADAIEQIDRQGLFLVLPELLAQSPLSQRTALLERLLPAGLAMEPDLVVYVGGSMVNKQLKLFLRCRHCPCVRIGMEECPPDTFCSLIVTVRCAPERALRNLAALAPERANKLVGLFRRLVLPPLQVERFSDLFVLQKLSLRLPVSTMIHLANSSVVRNAALFLWGAPVIACNRGVNGIEGSLSTAAGFSLADDRMSLCLIGDLSFFYDVNALWNASLRGNFRILMFNNGGGQIFRRLPGLAESEALCRYIAACHNVSARGVAESYNARYLCARTAEALPAALDALLAVDGGERPIVLEVFTRSEDNDAVAIDTDAQIVRSAEPFLEEARRLEN